jgi:polyhydroxyalkanoate synthesis regulator protein
MARVTGAVEQLVAYFGVEPVDGQTLTELKERCMQAFKELQEDLQRALVKKLGGTDTSKSLKQAIYHHQKKETRGHNEYSAA